MARWHEVDALFAEALERPPEERAAFLDEACGGDEALRREVMALLEAGEKADTLFEASGSGVLQTLWQEVAEGLEDVAAGGDRRIGPYRIVEELGRGGMSVVYLAERADGHFEQQVALKLLPRHLATEGRIARFRAERQILASLQHPNVARLLDGGVSEEGYPYLVMEHVDGVPLSDYCAEHACSVDERIRLLQTVCRAVQFAHRSLVVHRDLKPSNILVTPEGTVKLLDFGIAKLLDPDESGLLDEEAVPGGVPLTRTGEHLMTPEYAAPEQVRGEAITTATDVYQLGVLAYEVLAGRRPFRIEGRRFSEIERAVLETMPQRPSTAVTEAGQEDVAAAAMPGAPGDWSRRLRGDLDTIVLKALRKEPERRYASAEALVDDLERYLDGLPVEARPSTAGYRVRKFAQRHRWGLGAGVTALLVALAFVVLLVQQRDVALAERDRAQEAATQAEQMAGFMVSLFEASDPNRARGDTLTAYDLLDRGVARAEALDGQSAVQARMLSVIGRVYRMHGAYDRADTLLRHALALRRQLHPEPHPDVAASLSALAQLRQDAGDYEAADSLDRLVLAMHRRLYDVPHPDVAESLHDLAGVQAERGDYEAADSLYRQALAMRRRVLDAPHPAIARTLHDLGFLLFRKGAYAAAEPLLRESLAMQRRTVGDEHLETAETINDLALLMKTRGDYAAAELLYREALALDRKLLGADHAHTATTLNNLALLLMELGDHDEARALMQEALAIRERELGPEHARVATSLHSLAIINHRAGQYAAAADYERETIRILQAAYGGDHPRVAIATSGLGNILHDKGDYDEAEVQLRRGLDGVRESMGDEHPYAGIGAHRLADLLRDTGRCDEAMPLYRQALPLVEADSARTGQVLLGLGDCLAVRGDHEEAEAFLRRAYERLAVVHGAESDEARAARERLDRFYERYPRSGAISVAPGV